MGIPKEIGIAQALPAVLPVAKRTVKGKDVLTLSSCCSDVLAPLVPREESEDPLIFQQARSTLGEEGLLLRYLEALIKQPFEGGC